MGSGTHTQCPKCSESGLYVPVVHPVLKMSANHVIVMTAVWITSNNLNLKYLRSVQEINNVPSYQCRVNKAIDFKGITFKLHLSSTCFSC